MSDDPFADELASWRPAVTPPFASIVARRRSLLRRRSAFGGVGLAAVGVVAFAGLSGLTGGADRLVPPPAGPVAAPATATVTVAVDDGPVRYSLSWTDEAAYDANPGEPCLSLPGTSSPNLLYRDPPLAGITVTGAAERAAFEECVAGLPGVELTEVGIRPPATSLAGVAGVTVCLRGTQDCRYLDAAYAASLSAALDRTVPAPPELTSCTAAGPVYTVEFTGPGILTLPYSVPDTCGPVVLFDTLLLLDPAGIEQVRRAYLGAPTLEAFVGSCLGGDPRGGGQEYVRLTEADAVRLAEQRGLSIRVLGRDRECLGGRSDLRDDRLNVVTEAGVVVAAAVF